MFIAVHFPEHEKLFDDQLRSAIAKLGVASQIGFAKTTIAQRFQNEILTLCAEPRAWV